MQNHYIMAIQKHKTNNMESYNRVMISLFQRRLSWGEVKELDNDVLIELLSALKKQIAIDQSKYDIEKLAYAIQNSRSGAGGCAMTRYDCLFCGEEEWWGNTATPKICNKCAKQMATRMIVNGSKLEKD